MCKDLFPWTVGKTVLARHSAACSTQWSSEIAILWGVQDLVRQSCSGAVCCKAVQPWGPVLYQCPGYRYLTGWICPSSQGRPQRLQTTPTQLLLWPHLGILCLVEVPPNPPGHRRNSGLLRSMLSFQPCGSNWSGDGVPSGCGVVLLNPSFEVLWM